MLHAWATLWPGGGRLWRSAGRRGEWRTPGLPGKNTQHSPPLLLPPTCGATRVTWCAGATTVRSSEPTSTRKTTAVTSLRTCPAPPLQWSCPGPPWIHQPDRGAGVGTMTGGGAALRRIPVARERATVTALGTEGSMTATEVAWLDWCAVATTVRSSAPTTTRRTTAARDQQLLGDFHRATRGPPDQTGVPGVHGAVWLRELSRGNRSAGNESALSITAESAAETLRRDTQTLNVFKWRHIYHTINYPPRLKIFIWAMMPAVTRTLPRSVAYLDMKLCMQRINRYNYQ